MSAGITTAERAMQPAPTLHRFTVDDYHAMDEAGLLPRDVRLELIDGQLVEMSPIGHRHNAAVDRLVRLFVLAFGTSAIVRVQGSIKLPPFSEPQPDLLVLAECPEFYALDGAFGKDALLAVEVADSSLLYDMNVKAPLYAREGIPELWIVDLTRDVLLVYRTDDAAPRPQPQAYRSGPIAPQRARQVMFDIVEMLATARQPCDERTDSQT